MRSNRPDLGGIKPGAAIGIVPDGTGGVWLQHRSDPGIVRLDAAGTITVEGGKFNVNIRRITNAETALVHPNTIDLWVVLEGGGTLTAGGKLDNGKIVGGKSYPLKVGDVAFVPSGVPHGVSGVNGNITWLNVRWDNDWPANSELGAGRARGAPHPRARRGPSRSPPLRGAAPLRDAGHSGQERSRFHDV